MSYSGKKQYATIIPASIISRFLAADLPGGYIGFPHHGFVGPVLGIPSSGNIFSFLPIAEDYISLPSILIVRRMEF